MKYDELKKIIKENSNIAKKIYICNFLTRKDEKIKTTRISIITNILGDYVVTLWLDYEYNRFAEQQTFSDKDLAANYAWQLMIKYKNIM
jgi:hypothetical protein